MKPFAKHSSWELDRAQWIRKPQVQCIEHTHESEYIERGPRYLEFVRDRERREKSYRAGAMLKKF